jgi:Mn-dependent DtxR family transcriptional regulator
VLDELYERGLIGGSRKAKSVYLTEAGMAKAEALVRKYLKNVPESG